MAAAAAGWGAKRGEGEGIRGKGGRGDPPPPPSNLHNVVVADEAVAGGEVAVDKAVVLEEDHGAADLDAHVVQHLRVLRQVALVVAQVVEQAAVGHELRHDPHGPRRRAHAVQLHQVLVLELGHDLGKVVCQ